MLNGTYTITDGNLGNNEIPVSGDKPTSGTLTYSNNTLTNGCLTIGDYKVTFTNGEVSSTVKGECEVAQETVLYFTYDANATPTFLGVAQNSAKLPEPDASWKYYIKETTTEGVPSYGIELTTGEDKIQLVGVFDTEEACNETIAAYGYGSIAECKALEDKTEYELYIIKNYGLVDAVTFSLKPNDWLNSVTTLNTVFDGCNVDSSVSSAVCGDSLVRASADATYDVVEVEVDSDNARCDIYGFGAAYCMSIH